jgi:hypothetical protein
MLKPAWLILALTTLAGCQADQSLHVPRGQTPTAREIIPDQQSYKLFRAERDQAHPAIHLA